MYSQCSSCNFKLYSSLENNTKEIKISKAIPLFCAHTVANQNVSGTRNCLERGWAYWSPDSQLFWSRCSCLYVKKNLCRVDSVIFSVCVRPNSSLLFKIVFIKFLSHPGKPEDSKKVYSCTCLLFLHLVNSIFLHSTDAITYYCFLGPCSIKHWKN